MHGAVLAVSMFLNMRCSGTNTLRGVDMTFKCTHAFPLVRHMGMSSIGEGDIVACVKFRFIQSSNVHTR